MKVKVLENYKKTSKKRITEDVDPDDSVEEIASEIVDAAEEGTGNTASVDPAEAVEAAEEAKEAAEEIGASELVVEPTDANNKPVEKTEHVTYLKYENKLTRALDRCARGARYDMAKSAAGKEIDLEIPMNDHNLLVIGSPGCAKTAIVRNWAKARGMNLFSINMRDNELYAFVNGYPCKEDEDGRTVIRQAYSANLDSLTTGKKNSVLFLDEFNRQTNDSIRQIVMEVVKEKAVAGDSRDNKEAGQLGKRIFKDLLFTVAVMNPPDKSDKGLADLGDAEKDRFPFYLILKSNVQDTLNYVNSVVENELKEELAFHRKGVNIPDVGDYSKESVFLNAVYADLLKWHMLNQILMDASFRFDDDYDYLANEPFQDESGRQRTLDLSDPNDRAALAKLKQAKSSADRKKRVEEIRGLVSQRTISNLFMSNAGYFDFGKEPLADLIDDISGESGNSGANISTEKQIMLSSLIQDYIDEYNIGVGSNSDLGPSLAVILAENGKSLLQKAGYTDEEIKELLDFAKKHGIGYEEGEGLEDVDAEFEQDLADAGDDIEKISTIGVQRAKNADPVDDSGFEAGNAQAAQSAAAGIDWD